MEALLVVVVVLVMIFAPEQAFWLLILGIGIFGMLH